MYRFNHIRFTFKYSILAFALLLQTHHSNCQRFLYDYKRILINPIVSDNDVTNLAEDAHGLIWLSTIHQLYRFDGYSMDKIALAPIASDKPLTVINKMVLHNKLLYIASNNGIQTIQTCKSCILQPMTLPPITEEVLDVEAGPNQGVIFITAKGNLYQFEKRQFKRISLPTQKFKGNSSIVIDHGNAYVASYEDGIFEINLHSFQVIRKLLFPAATYKLAAIRKHPKGILMINEKSNAYLYDAASNRIMQTNEFGEGLTDIHFLNNELFTVNHINKLFHQFENGGRTIRNLIDLGAEKAERIHKTFLINDKIYVATTNGLVVLNYRRNNFNLLYETYNRKKNTFDVPRGLAESQLHYYLATYDKIMRIDKKSMQLEEVYAKPLNSHSILLQNDTLWLATEGNGFQQLNLRKKKLEKSPVLSDKNNSQLICLASIGNGKIVIGGYSCLLVFNQAKKTIIPLRILYHGRDLALSSVNQILPEDSNRFYIATGRGVFLVNDQGVLLRSYGTSLKESHNQTCYSIWKAPDKSIWAGTANGIFHFSVSGEIMGHLTRQEGLSGDRIASLLPDQHEHLWASTFTGLSTIDLKTGLIINFSKEEGLPDNEFNHAASLLTSNGDLIMGTMNGFVLFSPKDLNQVRKSETTLNISKIEYGNQEEQKTLLAFKDLEYDTVKLGKGINYVKLQFYLSPLDLLQSTVYEYKIKGVHNNWISMGNSPILHLDNFKPGKYSIQIRAITGMGSKDILTKTLPLIVEEYFYRSNWFIVLTSLVFMLSIMAYFSLLIRRDRKIVQIRKQIAEDLHDEVGSYLTGISMNIDLMKRKKGKEELYYPTIQSLGRKALKSLKDSLWSLDNNSDNALQLWDRVKSLASETYDSLDVDFSFHEMDGLEKINLTILEKTYLFYAIKECITNSIKHGDGNKVSFEWKKKDDLHLITITNSYKPKKDGQETGYGLYNIENRMKKIKAAVSFQNENQVFMVTFKLKF